MTDEERLINLIVTAKLRSHPNHVVDVVAILERDLQVARGEIDETEAYKRQWPIDKIEQWARSHFT